MARKPVAARTPLLPFAVSPNALAESLRIDHHVVLAGIANGEIRIFRRGNARRITIFEAVHWIENFWTEETKQRKVKSHG
ncbi:MAG: hypothetical protein ABSA68_02610 [Xanthobacteraceae bacterium]|jgi:hypothetical protein